MTRPEVCIRAPGASTHFADTCSDSHIKHSAKEGPFPNSFRDHYFSFFFFLVVHRGNTFRSSNVDIRFSRPRLHCRTVARAWISLMGMTRGATAFANTITARQLSLDYCLRERSALVQCCVDFSWQRVWSSDFRSNKNL